MGDKGKWERGSCFDEHSFVCEKEVRKHYEAKSARSAGSFVRQAATTLKKLGMKTDLAKALTHKISKVVDNNQAKVVKKLHEDAKKVIKKMAKNVKKTLTKDVNKKVKKAVKDHKTGTGKCSVAAQLVA